MNPFQLIYDRLWAQAEASVPLANLVKLNNRIKFESQAVKDPVKAQVSQADLPELMLVSTTASANMRSTSSGSMCVRQYDWIIATGSLDMVRKLSVVEWAVFCAMVPWCTNLSTLQWQGKPFIKVVNFSGISSGMSDPERNRGIRGWSAVWSLEVHMHFTTSDLVAFNGVP